MDLIQLVQAVSCELHAHDIYSVFDSEAEVLMNFSGIYGYHGNRKEPFLKITLALPKFMAAAKRLLERDFSFLTYPAQEYQAYESNVEFEIRYSFVTSGHCHSITALQHYVL